jgi:hypothetical protein
LKERGHYFTREPAGEFSTLVAEETAPFMVLHSYTSPVFNWFESDLYLRRLLGLPIGLMPLDQNVLSGFPRSYPSYFDSSLDNAASRARFQL